MERVLANAFLWLKAIHLVAVIAWMAGLFYLPRLFVYHAESRGGLEPARTFKVMERRLYTMIMWPAMVLAWASGAGLVIVLIRSGIAQSVWAWIKLVAVIAMTGLHLRLGWHLKQFEAGLSRHSGRYFRLINEAPTLLLIVIVAMVVTKPF
jgi:protoporphyrinogen IX oxidase